uniref:Uncharacterized protein n=1 Tax=Lotharella globosa TaxID=91324 RepID=A0A7S3YNB4_9EUKA
MMSDGENARSLEAEGVEAAAPESKVIEKSIIVAAAHSGVEIAREAAITAQTAVVEAGRSKAVRRLSAQLLSVAEQSLQALAVVVGEKPPEGKVAVEDVVELLRTGVRMLSDAVNESRAKEVGLLMLESSERIVLALWNALKTGVEALMGDKSLTRDVAAALRETADAAQREIDNLMALVDATERATLKHGDRKTFEKELLAPSASTQDPATEWDRAADSKWRGAVESAVASIESEIVVLLDSVEKSELARQLILAGRQALCELSEGEGLSSPGLWSFAGLLVGANPEARDLVLAGLESHEGIEALCRAAHEEVTKVSSAVEENDVARKLLEVAEDALGGMSEGKARADGRLEQLVHLLSGGDVDASVEPLIKDFCADITSGVAMASKLRDSVGLQVIRSVRRLVHELATFGALSCSHGEAGRRWRRDASALRDALPAQEEDYAKRTASSHVATCRSVGKSPCPRRSPPRVAAAAAPIPSDEKMRRKIELMVDLAKALPDPSGHSADAATAASDNTVAANPRGVGLESSLRSPSSSSVTSDVAGNLSDSLGIHDKKAASLEKSGFEGVGTADHAENQAQRKKGRTLSHGANSRPSEQGCGRRRRRRRGGSTRRASSLFDDVLSSVCTLSGGLVDTGKHLIDYSFAKEVFLSKVRQASARFLVEFLAKSRTAPIVGSTESLEYKIWNVDLSGFEADPSHVTVTFDEKRMEVRVTADQLSCHMDDLKWRYKQLNFPYWSGKGQLGAKMNHGSFTFDIGLQFLSGAVARRRRQAMEKRRRERDSEAKLPGFCVTSSKLSLANMHHGEDDKNHHDPSVSKQGSSSPSSSSPPPPSSSSPPPPSSPSSSSSTTHTRPGEGVRSERTDDKPVLWVAVKSKRVSVGDLDLEINAGSHVSSWFYNTLADMFKESLRKGLEDGLTRALDKNAEHLLDECNALAQQHYQFLLYIFGDPDTHRERFEAIDQDIDVKNKAFHLRPVAS